MNLIPSNRILWVLLVVYYPPLVTEVTIAYEFIVLLCVLWVFSAYLSPSSCHWRYCNWSYHILLDVIGTEYGSLALLWGLLDVGCGRMSSIIHRFEKLVTRKMTICEKIRTCGLIGGSVLLGVGSEFIKCLIKVQCFFLFLLPLDSNVKFSAHSPEPGKMIKTFDYWMRIYHILLDTLCTAWGLYCPLLGALDTAWKQLSSVIHCWLCMENYCCLLSDLSTARGYTDPYKYLGYWMGN